MLCPSTINYSRFAMKTDSYRVILVFLLAVSLLSFPVMGFAGENTLKVQCVDSSGNPMKDVKVVAFNRNSDKDKDKKTDARGEAEFTKLDDGVYRVWGRKEGFAPALYDLGARRQMAGSIFILRPMDS